MVTSSPMPAKRDFQRTANAPIGPWCNVVQSELNDTFHVERGFADFVKTVTLPACDYFVPRPGFIPEFDESQHFMPLREVALSIYPRSLSVGFDRETWIDHCRRIRAWDNDPL